MSNKPTYASPASPPPHYANVHGISQQDTGPSNSVYSQQYQQPYLPPTSPGPNDANKIQPFAENQSHIYPPDPAYGGGYYSGPQGPPPQGYYAPGPQMGGYYGPQPGMQVPPQGMYYQQQGPMYGYPQQGPAYGYYPQDRGMGGSGICAGLLGALACCCCLDMMF